MSELERIRNLFAETDKLIESLSSSPQLPQREHEEIELRQVINDQAYFVLAWGQFEAAVEDACKMIIRIGQSNADWRIRRVWALYNIQENLRMGFKNQLSLVLEENSSDWNLVWEYYRLRNRIAHGILLTTRISSSVFDNLIRIQTLLIRT